MAPVPHTQTEAVQQPAIQNSLRVSNPFCIRLPEELPLSQEELGPSQVVQQLLDNSSQAVHLGRTQGFVLQQPQLQYPSIPQASLTCQNISMGMFVVCTAHTCDLSPDRPQQMPLMSACQSVCLSCLYAAGTPPVRSQHG